MPLTDTCDTCNKQSLSFFLLRPSPIAKAKGIAPSGSEGMVNSDDLVDGLVPARAPTESRVILRTLRPGYVYIYVEKPVDGKHWLVFRVTEQGNVVSDASSFFDRPREPFACVRKDHNPEGLKLISIPRAHKVSDFWIAFSANRWNDTIKKRNAANAAQMQRVRLDDPPRYSFLPLPDSLKSRVLECRVRELKSARIGKHDFPFNAIANVDNLVDSLHRAAVNHPKTAGKQLAIVLRDPVGFATELNALRLSREEIIKQEAAKPANAHPLNSSATLMNIKHLIHQEAIESAANSLCQVVSRTTFDRTIKGSKNPRYAGAIWIPLPADRKHIAPDGSPLGRVWTTETRTHIHDNMDRLKERNWARIASQYDETARSKWLADFQERLRKDHYVPLERYEEDWWGACEDTHFKNYFRDHFDEHDPNNPRLFFSPGLIYTEEVARAMTPAPLTGGQTSEEYAKKLIEDVTQPAAVLLRALGANQAEVIKAIAGIGALNVAAGHAHSERNDKLYDLSSSVIQMSGTPNGPHGVSARYSWLSVWSAEAAGMYSLMIVGSLGGALAAMAARLGIPFLRSSTGIRMLSALQNYQLVQRAMDMAAHSVLSRTALKTPIVITKTYSFNEALRIIGARPGTCIDDLNRYTNSGMVKIELLTTADEMAAYGDDIDKTVEHGGGRFKFEGQQTPVLTDRPRGVRTSEFTDAQWERAIQARGKLASDVAYWLRESKHGFSAILDSVEGRLALGAVLINGASLWGNLSKLRNGTGTEKELRDALLGLIDASASVVTGLTQTLEVAVKASVGGRLGEQAVSRSISIHTLRASGIVLGTFAGVVTTIGQLLKTHDAVQAKQLDAAALYFLSGLSFAGLTAFSGLAAAGAIADRLVAKQIAGVVAQRIAARYGAQGIAVVAGVSTQGWGLGLLALAIVFEVGAVVLTPTEMQEWVQRSYFGYGKAKEPKFPIGDWSSEHEGIKRLIPYKPDEKNAGARTEKRA